MLAIVSGLPPPNPAIASLKQSISASSAVISILGSILSFFRLEENLTTKRGFEKKGLDFL